MLTIGGLLLGTVLTVPGTTGSAASADPFDPSIPRVAIAQGDRALGLRDPFVPDPRGQATLTGRRVPRPSESHADLRDPFAPRPPAKHATAQRPAPSLPREELRAPFDHVPASLAARPSRSQPSELRDPFGR